MMTDELKTDELKTDELKTDELKTDELKTDELKTDELKPCPFCGCHGIKYIAHEYLRHTIKCEDCHGKMECYSFSKKQAIAAWNRRAIEAEVTEPRYKATLIFDHETRTLPEAEVGKGGSVSLIPDHIALLMEARDFGQFAPDVIWTQAHPIVDAMSKLLDEVHEQYYNSKPQEPEENFLARCENAWFGLSVEWVIANPIKAEARFLDNAREIQAYRLATPQPCPNSEPLPDALDAAHHEIELLQSKCAELEAEAVAFKQQLTDKGTIVEASLQVEVEALKAELERYKTRAAAIPPKPMPPHAQLQDPDPTFWFG